MLLNMGMLDTCYDKRSVLKEEERIIVYPKYNDQTIRIGSTLPNNLKEGIKAIMQAYVDVFAWRHEDMPSILRRIIKHRLNVNQWFVHVKQMKRMMEKEPNRIVDVCKLT